MFLFSLSIYSTFPELCGCHGYDILFYFLENIRFFNYFLGKVESRSESNTSMFSHLGKTVFNNAFTTVFVVAGFTGKASTKYDKWSTSTKRYLYLLTVGSSLKIN